MGQAAQEAARKARPQGTEEGLPRDPRQASRACQRALQDRPGQHQHHELHVRGLGLRLLALLETGHRLGAELHARAGRPRLQLLRRLHGDEVGQCLREGRGGSAAEAGTQRPLLPGVLPPL